MRLAVYCDYSYRLDRGRLTAEQPIAVFLAGLAPYFEQYTLVGRLDEQPGSFPHPLDGVSFAELPHYTSGASAAALLRVMPVSARRFWGLLGEVDGAWVLGPTPLSLMFAGLTLLRRRRLILGVRQDLPRLFAHRYPDRPLLRYGARLLEAVNRAFARRAPIVVVGPELARRYGHARSVHTLFVSLLREDDLLSAEDDRRDYAGPELRLLSVGRIDPEKNPLLLADVLAALLAEDPRWRLEVCGDGPLREALAARLSALGVSDRARLHGHLEMDAGLLELYRTSHALLHVSFSEGLPQVLLEALASRLPVIATAVGGVPDLLADCGVLIPPGDERATILAVQRLIADEDRRTAHVRRGAELARTHSRDAESRRLVAFLSGAVDPAPESTDAG